MKLTHLPIKLRSNHSSSQSIIINPGALTLVSLGHQTTREVSPLNDRRLVHAVVPVCVGCAVQALGLDDDTGGEDDETHGGVAEEDGGEETLPEPDAAGKAIAETSEARNGSSCSPLSSHAVSGAVATVCKRCRLWRVSNNARTVRVVAALDVASRPSARSGDVARRLLISYVFPRREV